MKHYIIHNLLVVFCDFLEKTYISVSNDDHDDHDDDGSDEPDDESEGDDDGEGSYEIFVKMPSGENITIAVEASNTIDTVKAIVKNMAGIPRKQQRLIFTGEQLEDGRMLSEYNIQHNSSIQLLLGLSGGGIFIELKHYFFTKIILGLF